MAAADKIDDKDSLLKEAADALDLAQRREDAIKLAFGMVERGKIPAFESYGLFQEKVAMLLEKDLRVVEQALELDVDVPSMGKVASESRPTDLTAAFFHRLTED
ncbi:MAG: hypothetical protein EPN91_06610 [Salinibacterium sp.]|nr:MAG: hypothetical protein EPN91_06610 [Salinibacterium sp.]